MTVYIDDMYTSSIGRLGRMKMSHMIADTEEELHLMAEKIGMKRKWYQGDHYDVSKSRRLFAIQFGAIQITMRQCAACTMLRRMKIDTTMTGPEQWEEQFYNNL